MPHIRTHHITSRKKVLISASVKLTNVLFCYALLRSGGAQASCSCKGE